MLNWEEQFYQQFSASMGDYGITFAIPCSKDGTEMIPSNLVIPSRLKNSPYKGGTKTVPSRLLSRPVSHINSPFGFPSTVVQS